jgi:hypothetical protein
MKTYTCDQCGVETTQEHILWRYYFEPTDKTKVSSKTKLCPTHYGLAMPPRTHVAFDPLWALGWWAWLKKNPWWGLENSKKIYRFNYRNDGKPWAYAIVINGDYQDIKEAHVASVIRDGWVPDKISFDELVADLKNSRYREISTTFLQSIVEEFPEIAESLQLKGKDY